ncbi:MAG: AmmeMemoRadiSam system protein A, partial [Coriobacteriia bacterium]|nr:AmmeMemoRadiSam system protein A [Coriobacteriia bacterium]
MNGTDDRSWKSGYGSSVDLQGFELSAEERRALLVLARTSVETWVRTQRMAEVPVDLSARFPKLSTHRACFVTLREEGQLRGCIGSLEPRRSLLEDVRQNAVSAAVHDTRFRPVTTEELGALSYSISVLDLPRALQGVSPADLPAYMQKHKPGVIIEYRGRRSTFLPSVWEDLPDAL